MPDVNHGGGFLELTRIAAMAADHGVMVAPHNPSVKTSFVLARRRCKRSGELPSELTTKVEHCPAMGDLPGAQEHAGQLVPK